VLLSEFRVRARIMVKVRARVRDSWGTKRLGTKRLGYEMSGSRLIRYNSAADCPILLKLSTWCITGLLIKAQNDWWDKRPQVAMHR